MTGPDTMSFDSAKEEELDNSFDEACWESARSSWIYMEMEPRQRGCWLDNSFSVSYESGDRRLNSSGNSDGASVIMTSCNTSGVLDDTDTSLDFIEDFNFGHIEENVECEEVDYHKIDTEHRYTAYDSLLSNNNFILRKQSTEVNPYIGKILPNSVSPNSARDSTPSTRRSVSLDSYLPQKNQNLAMKQSETVHFPHLVTRIQALPPVPPYSQRFSKYNQAQSQFQELAPLFTSPSSRCPALTRADLDPDTESVVSTCTMATVSTTGSCNSLYRIPTKLRKLSSSSSSGNSSWSAITRKNTCSGSDPVKFQTHPPVSVLPKLLQDTFTYLWCENPDRDPFNTFSVSETDLTTAIVHLEQQLSNSVSNRQEKSRISLLSDFVQRDSPPTLSTSRGDGSSRQSTSTASDVMGENDNIEPSKNLPFRVQFIMESYCSIYMTR